MLKFYTVPRKSDQTLETLPLSEYIKTKTAEYICVNLNSVWYFPVAGQNILNYVSL